MLVLNCRVIFAIIVLCGIPLLVRKSGVDTLSIPDILSLFFGLVLVLALSFLPQGLFTSGSGMSYVIIQFLGGIIVAIALVLPGISASHMLYILGLYNTVLEHVYTFKWLSLLPLALGIIIGTLAVARILEYLINKYTLITYMIIIGFVMGSVVGLFN